ncbi:MAG TPA: hypothetical protein VKB75_02840 [Jatrophihabitans sp.]|nr:hypothetical protein [Jatrophihabitans sp.]
MSPSEFDLRAALHDDDGNGALDVDQLIFAARAHRSQRRTRILSTAAVVVAVAALGVGGGLLAGQGNSPGPTSGAAQANRDNAAASNGKAAGGSGTGFGSAGSASRQAPAGASLSGNAGCPTTLRSPAQASAASGPLFSEPVQSVVVCAYNAILAPRATSQTPRGHTVLRGAQATQLVNSLENAPTRRPQTMCPDMIRADASRFAFIGLGANGTHAGTVTTTAVNAGCGAQITNGTVTRYAWTPPSSLQPTLARLAPGTPAAGTVPIPSRTK